MKTNEKYIHLLEAFQKAHAELSAFFIDDTDGDYTHIIPSMYPFEQSFDDYLMPIKNWVDTQRQILQKSELETVKDVEIWFKQMLSAGINFHPDHDFRDYNTFASETQDRMNARMATAHMICDRMNVDIYGLGLDTFNAYFGEKDSI